jgi:hypothetical protein
MNSRKYANQNNICQIFNITKYYLIDMAISQTITDKMYPLIGIQVGNKYAEKRELD